MEGEWTAMDGAPWTLAADLEAELSAALGRLAAEDAVVLPLLAPADRSTLVEATEGLAYRAARPVIGVGERAVRQDFELCMSIPPGSPFHALGAALERAVAGALARLSPPPLTAPPRFNDLIVQRYRPGSLGITPHRDHVRYRQLVAIVTLAGQARFFLCPDRSGANAREVPIPPGSLLLMRAPGFAGRDDRPFHMLSEVTETRIALGLRHDVEAE
jgi:hypothetical protein